MRAGGRGKGKGMRKGKSLEAIAVKETVIPPCPPFTYLSDEMLLFNMPGNVSNGVSCLFQKGNNNFLSVFCLLVFLLPWEL